MPILYGPIAASYGCSRVVAYFSVDRIDSKFSTANLDVTSDVVDNVDE